MATHEEMDNSFIGDRSGIIETFEEQYKATAEKFEEANKQSAVSWKDSQDRQAYRDIYRDNMERTLHIGVFSKVEDQNAVKEIIAHMDALTINKDKIGERPERKRYISSAEAAANTKQGKEEGD